jgi:hypothetical protein
MPFDGCCLPGSPLAILLEADRKLTAERRASALLRKPPAPPAPTVPRRVTQGRASVIVFNRLLELFDGGRHWIQKQDTDGCGNFCMRGGLRHLGKYRGSAYTYLAVAINEATQRCWGSLNPYVCNERIIAFNDSYNYAQVELVIRRAREMAQADADGQG